MLINQLRQKEKNKEIEKKKLPLHFCSMNEFNRFTVVRRLIKFYLGYNCTQVVPAFVMIVVYNYSLWPIGLEVGLTTPFT